MVEPVQIRIRSGLPAFRDRDSVRPDATGEGDCVTTTGLDPRGTVAMRCAGAGAGAPLVPGGTSLTVPAVAHPLREALPAFNLDENLVWHSLELVRFAGPMAEEDREAMLVLLVASWVCLGQGSTRISLDADGGLDELVDRLLSAAFDAKYLLDLKRRIRSLILDRPPAGLVGSPGEVVPLVLDGDHLYHHRFHELEGRLAQKFDALLARSAVTIDTSALPEALRSLVDGEDAGGARSMRPSAGQLRAIEMAVTRPVAFLSGGPGTGKTSTLVSILRTLRRLGVEPGSIALAAPTGKAANRMAGALRLPELEIIPAPRTLHRLLGFSARTGRFAHHAANPLIAKIVVVDEASMVDISLMDRLLEAMSPSARLILLGDADQLPSVEAGSVFRDLVRDPATGRARSQPYVVELTESFRMDPRDPAGRNILEVARRVNAGDPAGLVSAGEDPSAMRAVPDLGDLRHIGAELLAAPAGSSVLDDFLEEWWFRFHGGENQRAAVRRDHHLVEDGRFDEGSRARLDTLFRWVESFRILCLTRTHRTGTRLINERMHALSQRGQTDASGADLFPGEPVIMLHNDYARSLFNGDIGLVLWVVDARGRRSQKVVFPGGEGYQAFEKGSLIGCIELAHALTVHKSQGSEYQHAVLVLPETDVPLNTREILYTGLTRSRRSVTVIGSAQILAAGVRRRIQRDSGLGDRLWSPG